MNEATATERPWEIGDRPDTIISSIPTTVIAEGVSPEDRPLIVRAVNRDRHFASLMEALSNAQEVIHLSFCQAGDAGGNKECWKECREAREALKAAEEATS